VRLRCAWYTGQPGAPRESDLRHSARETASSPVPAAACRRARRCNTPRARRVGRTTRVAAWSVHAARKQTVVAARRPARAARSPVRIEGLPPAIHLLVGYGPVQRCTFGEIAPTATREVPHAITGVHRLQAVLPLERIPQPAAPRSFVRTGGGIRIRHTRDTRGAAGDGRRRVCHDSVQLGQYSSRDTSAV